jgi:hypothetical protein
MPITEGREEGACVTGGMGSFLSEAAPKTDAWLDGVTQLEFGSNGETPPSQRWPSWR